MPVSFARYVAFKNLGTKGIVRYQGKLPNLDQPANTNGDLALLEQQTYRVSYTGEGDSRVVKDVVFGYYQLIFSTLITPEIEAELLNTQLATTDSILKAKFTLGQEAGQIRIELTTDSDSKTIQSPGFTASNNYIEFEARDASPLFATILVTTPLKNFTYFTFTSGGNKIMGFYNDSVLPQLPAATKYGASTPIYSYKEDIDELSDGLGDLTDRVNALESGSRSHYVTR